MKTHCDYLVCPCLYAEYHQQLQKENEKCTLYDDVYMTDETNEISEQPRGKKRKLMNDTNINNHGGHDKLHQNHNSNNNSNRISNINYSKKSNTTNQNSDTFYRYTVNITCNNVPSNNSNEIQNTIEKFAFSFN
ncbi:hypothetical protein BJ944DRAFT_244802 [Cunninghamella echinulata]|nr:hypothetical protein BJ944DRAFT_244802 [Cunninghamella echinulata]